VSPHSDLPAWMWDLPPVRCAEGGLVWLYSLEVLS